MKFNQLNMAFVLTLVLGTSAFAGEIWIPAPPPPPAASSETTLPSTTNVQSDARGTNSIGDSVSEAALNLLQTVLSLF